MRTLSPDIMIFSVFQKHLHVNVNTHVHNEVLTAMRDAGLPVIELQGRYNGVNELSILVQGFEHRAAVEHACKSFNQECYLESYNDRATSLVYPDGRRESIGTLTNVSESEAKAAIGYSFNPISGQYFVTK